MLGLKHTTVKLAPYSYKWSYLFQEEVINLRRVLNNRSLQVEHVGSTALNGIAAKPILDIFIPCQDVSSAGASSAYAKQLATLGYKLVTDGAHYKLYIKGSEDAYTHHLTFTDPEGTYWKETIQFRDYLLENPDIAKAYEAEKLKLVSKYGTSRRNYTANKAKFIQAILRDISSSLENSLETSVESSLEASFVNTTFKAKSPLPLLSTYVNPNQSILITQADIEGFVDARESKQVTYPNILPKKQDSLSL